MNTEEIQIKFQFTYKFVIIASVRQFSYSNIPIPMMRKDEETNDQITKTQGIYTANYYYGESNSIVLLRDEGFSAILHELRYDC